MLQQRCGHLLCSEKYLFLPFIKLTFIWKNSNIKKVYFHPVFVGATKIIFGYKFGAPLITVLYRGLRRTILCLKNNNIKNGIFL